MRGAAIIVAGTDAPRFQTALTLAASYAALGGRVRLLLDGEAVRLAPSGGKLLDSCFDLGVTVTLCQSGLAAAGLGASALDPRFDYGGMVGFLADLGEDRLLIV
jgi:predicted peroxiredoxin